MGEHTGIGWTDHTFNPWWGCAKVSAGCKNCYAETLSARFHGDRLWGVGGDRKIASEAMWREPLKWSRQAEAAGVRRRVFCASMADVFERHANAEVNAKLDAARARLWALIEATPHLDWQLLTKRPENIQQMVPGEWSDRHPKNVWLGTSVCGDSTDVAMVEHLALAGAVLGVVTFLSYEPAIGPPDAFLAVAERKVWPHNCSGGRRVLYEGSEFEDVEFVERCPDCCGWVYDAVRAVGWIIVGGESGRNARPFHADWARTVVEYGKRRGVPVFVKQLGSKPMYRLGGPAPARHGGIFVPFNLQHKSGADPSEWPEDLPVQEFPT